MSPEYEVAWAAGIFEGEGCFTTNKARMRPYATLSMTDEDTVRRFWDAVGVGNVTGPYLHAGNRKPYWRWQVSGGAVAGVKDLLWDGLGERRRARALSVLEDREEWVLAHG